MALKRNVQFKVEHIPGKSNVIADATSRKQWDVLQVAEAEVHSPPPPVQWQTMLSEIVRRFISNH